MITIKTYDFSSYNFHNFSKDKFHNLDCTSISPYDFTLDTIPGELKESKFLICEIHTPHHNTTGTFLFEREIGSDKPIVFKKILGKDCLLQIKRNENDNSNILIPYALGKRIGSDMWEITLVDPQIFENDFKEDVFIKSLDDGQSDHYRFMKVDTTDPKKITYRSKT